MPNWRDNPRAKSFIKIIEFAANEQGIDPDLLGSVIERESQFDPNAQSEQGAAGIAQLVPKWHPGVDASEPVASIREAAKYLKQNLIRFKDTSKALAAYNHGPTAVRSYGKNWQNRIPKETQDYVSALSPSPDDLINALRGQ